MEINHVKLQDVVLNMERLNIAMSVSNIHVKNTNTLMTMIFLLRADDKKQI